MQKQQRKRDVEDYNTVKTTRARGALHTEADDVLLGRSAAGGAAQQHGGRRLLTSLRRALGRAVDRVTCTEDVPDGKDRTERWAAVLDSSCRKAAAPMHVALDVFMLYAMQHQCNCAATVGSSRRFKRRAVSSEQLHVECRSAHPRQRTYQATPAPHIGKLRFASALPFRSSYLPANSGQVLDYVD
jgi:hypothetical protein